MEEGIEVGLINNFISIARTLRARGIEVYPASIEALKGLAIDEDVRWLLEQADNEYSKTIEDYSTDENYLHVRGKL